MNNQSKKDDVAGTPNAGVRDSKGKHAQLEVHPRKGRARTPSTQDEVQDAKENKNAPERGRVQQLGKNHEHKLIPTAQVALQRWPLFSICAKPFAGSPWGRIQKCC
jgi:hypothetical protein